MPEALCQPAGGRQTPEETDYDQYPGRRADADADADDGQPVRCEPCPSPVAFLQFDELVSACDLPMILRCHPDVQPKIHLASWRLSADTGANTREKQGDRPTKP